MKNETWVDIKGYEGHYQVSNKGGVRSLDRTVNIGKSKQFKKGIVLKITKKRGGYLGVCLRKNGKSKNFYVHRLVAINFIENKNNLPQVNHIDGNKLNNNVSNLEWSSSKDNVLHSYKNNLKYGMVGINNPKSILKDEEVCEIFTLSHNSDLTQNEIADIFNVSQQTVSFIKNGKTWKHLTKGR